MTGFEQHAQQLLSDDPGERTRAIHAIAVSGHPLAVEALVRLLRDESKIATHTTTLRALGRLGGDRAIRALVDALDHDHATIRDTAAHTLGSSGDPAAVKPLIRALQGGHGPLRAAAAEALGKLRDPRAIEPLIHALRDDRADVRFQAAQALGPLGDDRAVQPLIAALDDYAALYQGAVCEAAAESLAQIDHADGKAALARWRAVWDVFADLPDVPTLIDLLHSDNWEIRHTAALILGERGNATAIDPLIAALDDADPVVRGAAAESLGTLGAVQAVEPLVTLLQRAHDVRVQRAAITALGMLADDRALPALVALLDAPTGDLDFTAAIALEQIDTRPARRAVQRWRKSLDRNPRFPPPPPTP